MIDPLELALALLVPGFFIWGFSFLPGKHTQAWTLLGAGLGIATAMFALRFVGEFRGLGDQALVGEALQRTISRLTPPREARDWLIPLVLLAGIVGTLDYRWRRPGWSTMAWGMWVAGAFWVMLRGSIYFNGEWTTYEAACWLVSLGAIGVMLSWMLTSRNADGANGGISLSLGLVVGWACTSVLLLTSGSQTFGMLGLTVTAASCHAATVAIAERRRRGNEFAGGFWGATLIALLGMGLFFAEVTLWRGAVIVAALAIFGAMHRLPWRGSRWGGWLILIAALGWVMGSSIAEFQEKMREQESNPYRSAYGGP